MFESALGIVFASDLEEVAEHLQSDFLAFLGMILHAVDVASACGCREGFAVARGRRGFLGVKWLGEVGVNEIDERVWRQFPPERVSCVGEIQFIPADLGNFESGRCELSNATFEESDAVFARGLLARFE